ncbi:MAG: glutamate--tRNA ligase [Bacteroidetes bacterium]|jgi:glutamyl-tRNA synthetase|nr:glutamate--tRNA ligase [Bacteroidota bacterium]
MEQNVRVRFAPSPTGPLHMGGVRTALFNYLFAKKHNGSFILRIEDTDQARYVEGAEQYILDSLQWCGLTIDEGVSVGGKHQPYRQSERKDIYKQFAEKLIANGSAYFAFDTPEELETIRKEKESDGKTFSYDAHIRSALTNSFNLPANEVKQRIDSGQPYVIRFKMPENRDIQLHDLIRGDVTFNTSTLDDKVLYKSDGLPTYHLANVVDDHLMEISHVIRGEEWLPSLPLHFLLYEALGWHEDIPDFAHLPLLLKPSGKGKLSKRDGDKLGFPVFPLQWNSADGEVAKGYREDGYFPEAFINILALLGWNPGTEQEIFSMDELINAFDMERVGKAGARFDPEKAKWFNQHYLKQKPDTELAELFIPSLKEKGIETDLEYTAKVISLVKERVQFVHEIWDQAYYFFQAPREYDAKVVKKKWKENTSTDLKSIIGVLQQTENFTSAQTELAVKKHIEEKELHLGNTMNAIRLAIVGQAMGPHLFDIFELIGKNETIARLQKAIDSLG